MILEPQIPDGHAVSQTVQARQASERVCGRATAKLNTLTRIIMQIFIVLSL